MKKKRSCYILPKTRNKLFPAILTESIINGLKNFQGREYRQSGSCTKCGSYEYWLNHFEPKKLFCRIIDANNNIKKVTIGVQYFTCKSCGKVYKAKDAPFVEKIDYGKPVIELAFYFSDIPYHQTEKYMADLGVQLDRDTIRKWHIIFGNKIHQKSTKRFANSSETRYADLLELMFGKEKSKELSQKVEGVADETYPTRKGEKGKFRKENKKRKAENKEEKKYPNGFTLASAFAANLKIFCSLLVSIASFNRSMAEELLSNIMNAFSILTDGHLAYEKIMDNIHLRCIIHRFRNSWKKYAKNKIYPEGYFKEKYQEFLKDMLVQMQKEFPQYFDISGNFIGCALSTNAIEGGNWRVKYMLKTLYSHLDSIFGRSAAILIKESMSTFLHCKPCESFGHRESSFSFFTALV